MPDWTLAYSWLECLEIQRNSPECTDTWPLNTFPYLSQKSWFARSNLSNHGSNSSQYSHGNHSPYGRFSESSGCRCCSLGGTRFRRAVILCHLSEASRSKELRGHGSGDPRAAELRRRGMDSCLKTLWCEENGSIMSCRKYVLHRVIQGVFRPRSSFPCIGFGAWPHSPKPHAMPTSFSGCSYFVLQPIYGVFDKPGYVPRLLQEYKQWLIWSNVKCLICVCPNSTWTLLLSSRKAFGRSFNLHWASLLRSPLLHGWNFAHDRQPHAAWTSDKHPNQQMIWKID